MTAIPHESKGGLAPPDLQRGHPPTSVALTPRRETCSQQMSISPNTREPPAGQPGRKEDAQSYREITNKPMNPVKQWILRTPVLQYDLG